MVGFKQKSLILDIVTNKKLNAAADKSISIYKEKDNAVDKKLNIRVDKAINTDKRQNAAAIK